MCYPPFTVGVLLAAGLTRGDLGGPSRPVVAPASNEAQQALLLRLLPGLVRLLQPFIQQRARPDAPGLADPFSGEHSVCSARHSGTQRQHCARRAAGLAKACPLFLHNNTKKIRYMHAVFNYRANLFQNRLLGADYREVLRAISMPARFPLGFCVVFQVRARPLQHSTAGARPRGSRVDCMSSGAACRPLQGHLCSSA